MTSSCIAQLKAKYCRIGKSKYWVLELAPHSTLTKRLLNSQSPRNSTFFLFGEKVRWASALQPNQDYYWIYKEVRSSQGQKLYQIQDWKLLGEPKTVRRMGEFIKNVKISL